MLCNTVYRAIFSVPRRDPLIGLCDRFRKQKRPTRQGCRAGRFACIGRQVNGEDKSSGIDRCYAKEPCCGRELPRASVLRAAGIWLDSTQLRNDRPSSLRRSTSRALSCVLRRLASSVRAYCSGHWEARPPIGRNRCIDLSPPPWIFLTSQLSSRLRGDPSFFGIRSAMFGKSPGSETTCE